MKKNEHLRALPAGVKQPFIFGFSSIVYLSYIPVFSLITLADRQREREAVSHPVNVPRQRAASGQRRNRSIVWSPQRWHSLRKSLRRRFGVTAKNTSLTRTHLLCSFNRINVPLILLLLLLFTLQHEAGWSGLSHRLKPVCCVEHRCKMMKVTLENLLILRSSRGCSTGRRWTHELRYGGGWSLQMASGTAHRVEAAETTAFTQRPVERSIMWKR